MNRETTTDHGEGISLAGSAPSRRVRIAIDIAGLGLAILIVWGVVENNLFQFAFVVGALALGLLVAFHIAARRKGLRWFVTRRALKFYGWTGATLISVIVLFYTFENWRGQRAWTALQREVAARGESLELASVIPPDVPAEQNFFSAPGVMELLKPQPGTNGAGGTPSRSVFHHGDAWSWEPPGWSVGSFRDLSATAKSFSSFNGAPASADAAAAIVEAVAAFEPQVGILRQGAGRLGAKCPIDYDAGWAVLGKGLHHILTGLRDAGHLLDLRASAMLSLGKPESALADISLALRLGDVLRNEPFMAAHQTRSKMLLSTMQPIFEGLSRHSWNEPQLRQLQQLLETRKMREDWRRGARGETIITIEMANQLEAFLEGRSSSLTAELNKQRGADAFAVWCFKMFYPRGWLAQDRVWVYRFYREHAERNWRLGEPEVGDRMWQSWLRSASDPMLLVFVVPRMVQTAEDSLEWGLYLDTICAQAATACALERFRLTQGTYPAQLTELVPEHIQAVPPDLAKPSGEKLTYKRVGPASYKLYSIGLNRMDDGGKPLQVEEGFNVRFREEDWVWQSPVDR